MLKRKQMTKNKNKILFVPTKQGIENIKEILPKPAGAYIPEWWKTIPTHYGNKSNFFNTKTAKRCPAIPEMFSQGFILPMWSDALIYYDDSSKTWLAKTPYDFFSIQTHPKEQFLNYAEHQFKNEKATFIFKFESPWSIITPKGWSVMQLPLFYHFDKDFSVLPGVINTDSHHQINQQVAYYGDKKEVFIPRGTPLVQYIPFKREKLNMEIASYKEHDDKLYTSWLQIAGVFSKGYRNLIAKDKDSL
jgi:hypothetical protein